MTTRSQTALCVRGGAKSFANEAITIALHQPVLRKAGSSNRNEGVHMVSRRLDIGTSLP